MAIATDLLEPTARPKITGVPLWVVPDAFPGFTMVFERAPDSSGAPGTFAEIGHLDDVPQAGGLYIDPLPLGPTIYWYRVKATRPGYTDSAYTGPVSAKAQDLGQLLAAPNPAAAHLFQTVRGPGALASATAYYDGAGNRVLSAGIQRGTVADGGTVTFPFAYNAVPKVRFWGGIQYEPRSAQWSAGLTTTAPQYEDFAALNLTATGFTARARLRQIATPTNNFHDFGTTVLDVVDETVDVTLTAAPASSDTYTVRAWTHLEVESKFGGGFPVSISVTYAIDTSADGGSSWTQRATVTVTLQSDDAGLVTLDQADDTVIVVSGLSGTAPADKIRLRFVSKTTSGVVIGAVAQVRGAQNSAPYTGRGVSYVTSTDSYASKTPGTGDVVNWEAYL